MKLSILIIDDSLTVRMDLDEAFQSAGFATTLCGTAAAARQTLARTPFALVVLDVLLPDGDGVDFLREIRLSTSMSKTPVLLLSTEAEVRDRIRGLKTGADDYVGKPYDRAYVVSRARELVRKFDRPAGGGAGAKVLVIDDSATFRAEVRGLLELKGYEVATAASGEEGLRLAADLRPRAIVVDGYLPGIDGATVIRRIRQDAALRRTPCLLLTASEDPGGELRALDSGADAYVRKEEDAGVILAKLSAILRFSAGAAEAEGPSTLLSSKRVLAVDDSNTYLQELAGQLRQEGYEAVLARSGSEALEMLAVQPVDCVLLDLVMPGLSGHETCRRIKGSPGWRDIPVIMLTAREEREAMIEGINAGADDYIAKSSDFEVLKARLRAQIRRKQFEDENRQIREQLLHKEVEATEARASRELAEVRARLLTDLERKNRELETFSYSVSHDLRAPLRAIEGFSRILLEDHGGRLDAEAKRVVGVVVENAGRMSQLIDDLLKFSRMGRTSMNPVEVDMEELARSVLGECLGALPGRAVEASVGPLPGAWGDRSLLRQVFANLIGNALKYSRTRDPARVEVVGRRDGEEGVYMVRDNGIGFDMAHAPKLFRVFQRLPSAEAFEGTGVGLALVQRIIERHGGRVWAEAQVDGGASFSFSLPPCVSNE